jgi:hypothetical protein
MQLMAPFFWDMTLHHAVSYSITENRSGRSSSAVDVWYQMVTCEKYKFVLFCLTELMYSSTIIGGIVLST